MLCRLTAAATGAAAIVLEVAEDSPLAEHQFSTRAEIRNRLKKFMEQCRFIIIPPPQNIITLNAENAKHLL